MQLRVLLILFSAMPAFVNAADCEDTDIFNEKLLVNAVSQLVTRYGPKATSQAIYSCESGPGAKRLIKLAAHEQDDKFTYYRMVSCDLNSSTEQIACEASEGRRIKYHDATIDTDNATDDKSVDETQTKNSLQALDCFSQGLQAGTVKIRKYNRLLDTNLDIPLALDTTINSINVLPGFRRYIVNVAPQQYRFSIELDKEYGCFIEPLK
jgi:hypothetical protein